MLRMEVSMIMGKEQEIGTLTELSVVHRGTMTILPSAAVQKGGGWTS